jgi:LCP family protein required for cell wall assembly
MTKKIQSIDGFTLKRRDSVSTGSASNRAFLDEAAQPKARPQEPEFGLRKAETAAMAESPSSDDIEESLQNLEDDTINQPSESPRRSRRTNRIKLSRRERKKLKSERKKRHPIRRVVKWFFIIILVLVLALVGWLAFKALVTGGKIFQGNVLDIFTSKTRLAEDKNGRTNVLIFGTSGYSMSEKAWDGALLTDSIMVISVDQDKHDAYMISLPRDLYVKHACKKLLGTSAGKLNETYYCNYYNNRNEDEGAAALRETAGDILGLEIQYFIHADWTALVQGVDAVGGVDVTIESDNEKGIYDRNTGLRLPKGEVHLSGEGALMLARSRGDMGGYGVYSNFDREKNQQKVLAALQQKALSAGTLANPAAVNSLLDALGDNLRTNFKTSEVQTLLDLAKNIKSGDMISLPLVDRGDGKKDLVISGMLGNISIVRPVLGLYDYSDIQDYVKESISADPMTREAAKIDVLNGSEQAGFAQKKADELKEAGYKIGKVANAPSITRDKVKIYQLNTNKTTTASALEKRFDIKITSEKLDGYDTKADFIIVFGAAATE